MDSQPPIGREPVGTPRFLAMAFRSEVRFLPIARGIEAVQCGGSPSRASFGKVGSIMKRLRVPIDRHADGQLTEARERNASLCSTTSVLG
jgi:hypothetical protein